MTAREIEVIYRTEMLLIFPYDDCGKLRGQVGIRTRNQLVELIAGIDYYCSYVAGFASSATTLKDRPVEELVRAIDTLGKRFFDQFPQYRHLGSRVTLEATPDLYRELGTVDSVRIELANIMRKIVSES